MKDVVTTCVLRAVQCVKMRLRPLGAYSAPPDLVAGFGRGKEKKEGRERRGRSDPSSRNPGYGPGCKLYCDMGAVDPKMALRGAQVDCTRRITTQPLKGHRNHLHDMPV